MLAANNWNVVQYAVLVHMMAQVSGLEAGELVHVIADAHIYDRHVPIVREAAAAARRRPAPAFVMDPAVTDFYRLHPGQLPAGGVRPPAPLTKKSPWPSDFPRPTGFFLDRKWPVGYNSLNANSEAMG